MKIFIANWKMQLSIKEGVNLAKKIKEKLEIKNKLAKVVLCPSFDSLGFVAKAIRSNQKSRIFLGAQDVFWEERGAYTGEVSVLNLKETGCEYVILGHSERRKLGETDEEVRKKVMTVLKAGLIPIICIGETLSERKEGKTKDVIRTDVQLFSESTSRYIVEVEPEKFSSFVKMMLNIPFGQIGKVTEEKNLSIKDLNGKMAIKATIDELKQAWQKTFNW